MAWIIAAITGSLLGFVMFILTLFAWITHVVVCIKTASWILLIIGAFVFPIGVIHGWAIWFGIV
jgi:hypothetical protein